MWLDFIVAENSGTAVAPFTVDSAMLIELKLGRASDFLAFSQHWVFL